MWRMILLTGLSILAIAGISCAQELPEWLAKSATAKPPDYGVRDDNGFFNHDSGALKRISEQLRKLETDHGFKMYLLVEPVLIATSAPELAARLQQSWLPRGDGLVVVYESDNRSIGFGRDIGAAAPDQGPASVVPTHETATILMRARESTEETLAPEAYVEALMTNLVREFDQYFQRRKAPLPAGRSLRLALLTIGGLTLLALTAIVVGALVRLPAMARNERFRFSRVDRPERLGAPCGGGNVTTRRFRSP